MKYVDEFRDAERAEALLARIRPRAEALAAAQGRPVALMEICGGHTHAIFRHGIEGLLPPAIELVHGPGCPVCVLPTGRVDDCVAIAETPGVILTSFGDALRVPGSRRSLAEAKAAGADVRVVYSPLDALALARSEPGREVVFFGLGFETTMPSTAFAIQSAAAEGRDNFSVFCNHILIAPVLAALLEDPEVVIDAFLGPGHVSMVIGTSPYRFIAADHGRPLVVTGFEPLDILQGVDMALAQLAQGRAAIETQYTRAVPEAGNPQAQAAMAEVFEPRAHFEWRGLGSIAGSGVKIRPAYAAHDAERRFELPQITVADPEDQACGAVLRGVAKPRDCPSFGEACTPKTPLGALMVSSEGACAAYYRFGRFAAAPALVQLGQRGPR